MKWGRENYPGIEVNTDEEPILFKAQLYALTGVQPDRQKVMCKGITLKDDEWNVALKNGIQFLLLGTKDELAVAPIEKTKFIEDMNESELAVAVSFFLLKLKPIFYIFFVVVVVDGTSSWFIKFRKYLLYECNSTMSQLMSRTS